jgi:predicted dehydrogenase
MHAEYTIRAAKAGKHVLCEKPMSTNIAEAEAMIAACKEARVKLMIAYRCHYEPTNLKAIRLIRMGALGQVQAIESSFRLQHCPRRMAAPQEIRWRWAVVRCGYFTPSTHAAT